ncbi:MAG: adenine deaminase [Chloroflexi bacterium]|nr:adenine deaminase [Chloroflexota bacterium]
MANTASLIKAARGLEPADLLLANARVVNTFTGEIERQNVAILGDRIAGVGDYSEARETWDLDGMYVAPGFIDGHTHVESSLLHITQYARAVVPRGTTSVVTDLHEIANVCGLEGIKYVLRWTRRLPLDVYVMAPSCVPATSPDLETSGAILGPAEISAALREKGNLGLGEMMDYPGVLSGDDEVIRKLEVARGKVVDGHAPRMSGKELNGYIAAGIHSDHESTAREEGAEKLRRGMRLFIREGSSEKNLEALLPLITDKTYKRCSFVVDDRTCLDLLEDGDMDAIVRKAIKLGLDPVRAIQLATINNAEYFRLWRLGAVAPGYTANLVTLKDLSSVRVDRVIYHGQLVSRAGRPLFSTAPIRGNNLSDTVRIKPLEAEDLAIPAGKYPPLAIEAIPGQIVTRKLAVQPKVQWGKVVADIERDLLKLVVVERHKATGNTGRGLVRGFGLRSGALATSIAHDSHNIVCVGTNDRDMLAAIKEIERLQGGLVVAERGKILGSLALPIAGLLSPEPAEEVSHDLRQLEVLALGMDCRLPSPFATLSFLALPVIPELRLTDKGLVDVTDAPKLIEM